MIPSTFFSLLLTLPALGLAASRPKNAILLSDVESLTLRGHGAMAKHRRVPAVPQLRCLSGRKLCGLFEIDVMRCVNQGSSYGDEDIQWSCTASLPEELQLGSTDVICEGYSSPDDDYVLKGSCAVEYRLALTSKGRHRYPNLADGDRGGSGDTDFSGVLFFIIFALVLGFIIYSACMQQQANRGVPPENRRGGGGGGWGPGPGPGPNDPPPPYPGTKPSGQDRWKPGFWTGATGGAAAGYWAGSRNRDDGRYDNGYGSVDHGHSHGHGWGGGSSRSSSSGSNRHESTGFGSTSRR